VSYQSSEDTLARSDAQTLRRHRQAALELPEPGDDWALAETRLTRQDLQTLSQVGAVTPEGREHVSVDREYSGGAYSRQRWVTEPVYFEWVQDHLTDARECPAEGCHATGIYNPPSAEGYRCNNDDCDERLSEQQARELLG
jgi:hypothetical protein